MNEDRLYNRTAAFIGEKVRNKRPQDGLSDEAVARALNCNINEFRAAEAGEVNFSAENIVGLSSILRVTPSWFFVGLA